MKQVPIRNLSRLFLSSLIVAAAAQAQEPSGSSKPPVFDPVRVVRRFPPIIGPEFTPAAQAKINDNELVLGVAVGGSARAYPINMLTQPTREIINDRLAGKPIAATG